MGSKFAILAVSAMSILFAVQSNAVTINFLENGSNVPLGTTSVFTDGGFSITASGFLTAGGTTGLYAKNEGNIGGSNEMGLGTTSDPTGDYEITTSNFIQLRLPTTPPSNFQLVLLTSVQSGESAKIYFTHTPGTLVGATLIQTVTNADGSVTIPGMDQSGYIDITAGLKNVLLNGIVIQAVPDGGSTVALFGFALAGIAFIRRAAAKSNP
jgi:VPDSG-CTERM motif